MEHPGVILFVDGLTDRVIREAKAEEVPEAVRFAPTPDGPVPVVRIVCFDHPGARIIREYGPNGELLRDRIDLRSEEEP